MGNLKSGTKALLTLWMTGLVMGEVPSQNPKDMVVVRPAEAPGPLDNPLKGYCPYVNAGKIHRPYSMSFLYASWKKLEPRKGYYAFDAWEREEWNHPRAEGKHLVLRVFADYPGKPSGLPDWLRTEGVEERNYQAYGGGKSPDYDHPEMVLAMERFISALGKRYNNHPRVAFIQLGLLGFWGEWHTYPHEEWFASEKTQRRIIRAYLKAFPDKQLMARYADGTLAEFKKIGFHDDMFPEDTDNGKEWSFLARMRRGKHINTWKKRVIGGEMAPPNAPKWLGGQWNHTLEMIRRSHFSWIGPYGPALESENSAEFLKRSDELVRRMGYQFRIEEIRYSGKILPGTPCKFVIRAHNDGVAPFYYPWPVQLAWIGEDGKVLSKTTLQNDARQWLPGPFSLEGGIPAPTGPGIFRLGFGIEDPWQRKPAVRLANRLPMEATWTILGRVEVLPEPM